MSTQPTATPRAPRGKPQSSQSAAQPPNTPGRQSHRKPRGNRSHNGQPPQNGAAASPSKFPPSTDPAFADSAVLSGEDAQAPNGPRHTKKHTQSQPSMDRVFSPAGAQASLTDSEAIPINPSGTPAKAQAAYAGPTFHASPAPSALPIPKFLSRSVPAKTRSGPPTPPPEDSSDSAASPSPSPASQSRAPIPVPTRDEDSPLDMLFKADRAERAKHVHGSPVSNGFFSPSIPQRPPHYKQDSFTSINGVFPIELDGESRDKQFSPPAASPPVHRSITDPNLAPHLQDASPPNTGNDVMQDLFNRLSMSQQRNPNAATPPRATGQAPSDPQSRHQTPSPFHDGRSTIRSASGPSTPAPASHESSDIFYGNRNLSPLFKAAKGDPSKRNSGLRTEITADSPTVPQSMFQDVIPTTNPPKVIDPNAFSRGNLGNDVQAPTGPRRGSVPFIPPYQHNPNNNRRRTPGRQSYQPRPDSYPAKSYMNGPGPAARGKAPGNSPATSAPKPATSVMSFVPASVAAKQHSSASTPPSTEQDLKRLLNLKITGDTPSVR
ncbi:hypothetical protein IQ07DRAFT_415594 [Pyrenochaeta sp. DS3sAY3a]|nr:hypothetical protein IQ07DRAFT_415594 [Pyrenochaeta sp. DS3sAY3a]